MSSFFESIEFSTKATFLYLGKVPPKDHKITADEFAGLVGTVPTFLDRSTLSRLYVLMGLWSKIYIVAKYGVEALGAPADGLFLDDEAKLAEAHAEEAESYARQIEQLTHPETKNGSMHETTTIIPLTRRNSPATSHKISPELIRVYSALRKEVKGWQDRAYSWFREWTVLEEDSYNLLSQIKKTAPDLYDLCDQAAKLFAEISPLRGEVGTFVRDEELRLAQEYQSRFDDGSKVESPWLRIKVDGGNERPLYLEHAFAFGLKTGKWAETFAQKIIQNSKSWSLELMVQGKRMGNPETRSVASGNEAVSFGDRVLQFLEKQPSASQLTKKIEKTLELRERLLPRLEKELSKG